MASTFNEMLDTVEEVFIHEKQFSSDVSHELRTPITVILAQSDYALQYSDTFEEAKETILNDVKRNLFGQAYNQLIADIANEKVTLETDETKEENQEK